MRKRPTRRDLLLVVGELQTIIGQISESAGDRNPNRAADIETYVKKGFQLALDARNFDPPTEGGSRNGWPYERE